MADKKWSQFPSAAPENDDAVVGLHAGGNVRFPVANFVLAIRQGLINLFVPQTRTVNGKALSSDISLTMDDISNGTTYAKTTAAQVAQIGTNQTNIGTIEGKIPSAASTSNQLADKAFVTDAITQGTAIFRGSFASRAALLAVAWQTTDPDAPYYVSNNDYAVVLDDETQNDECWRYIYVTGTGWTPQYRINETPLTQAQLDALNSGATAAIIGSVADKLDKTGDGKDVTATFTAASTRANISTGEKLSVLFGKIAKWFSDLGTAAFRAATGSITSGSTDLVESGAVYTGLAGKQPTITASGMLKGDGLGGVSAATEGADYQAPLTAGTDYATPAMIPTVPDPSDATPQNLGTADSGVSDDYSRADHVHEMPTASDVGARADDWVPDAEDIPYDNTTSGLMATDVQAAIDEIAQGGGGGGTAASAVSYDNTGSGLTATNVQDAIDEVVDDLDGKQDEITASGILKGDGAGGVSAATPGTDYQEPLTAGTDYATPAMIPSVPAISTSTPNMDGTGAAGSTGDVSDAGHVHPTDTSRLPVYGKGENLLRNWYFVGGGTGRGVFPVNQRGESSYTGAKYGIDRWYLDSSSRLDIVAGGIQLGYTSGSFSDMYQVVERSSELLGKKVTLSIWDSNGLHSASGTILSSFPGSLTNIININDTNVIYRLRMSASSVQFVWIEFTSASSSTKRTVYAVKLELGDTQTICHNEGTDANPIWVLNEIPDYEEELIKCQTSTADSTDTFANKSLATEQQLAYVETGTTASRTYVVGEYFCWNGLLYRVISPISSGQQFNPGANCIQTTVGTQLSKIIAQTITTSVPASLIHLYTVPVKAGATVVANVVRNNDSGLWNKILIFPLVIGDNDLVFYLRNADGSSVTSGNYTISFIVINP